VSVSWNAALTVEQRIRNAVMPRFYAQSFRATRAGMPTIVAACCVQRLHATIAHETTSKIIGQLLHKNCMK